MSTVTNLILATSVSDKDKINEVNKFPFRGKGLVNVEDASPVEWYGGSKFLECELFIGAFNGLDLKEFGEHLKTIKWDYIEAVQIIVKEQEDEKFRIINLDESVK